MKPAQLRSIVLSLASFAIIVIFGLTNPNPTPPSFPTQPELFYQDSSQIRAQVERVVDGDTIKLTTGETIRYIGIDTPETKHPQKGVECFGPEATQANAQLVEDQEVTVIQDVSTTDRYDRILGYIYVDDLFVNEYLVANGFARAKAYPPDTAKQEQLASAQITAKQNNRGLWDACN